MPKSRVLKPVGERVKLGLVRLVLVRFFLNSVLWSTN